MTHNYINYILNLYHRLYMVTIICTIFSNEVVNSLKEVASSSNTIFIYSSFIIKSSNKYTSSIKLSPKYFLCRKMTIFVKL